MKEDVREFAFAMLLLVVTLMLLGSCTAQRGCFPTTKAKQIGVPHSKNPKGFL
jgi:hypothetical protein